MNNSSLILGIDPGTGRTGWGIIEVIRESEEMRIKYIAHGCIVTEKIEEMHNRLLTLHETLDDIVAKYQPTEVIVEQIFFGMNSKTAISVSQARGVILLVIAKNKLPMFEYTSASVKLGIAGNGRMEKKDVQLTVRRILKKNRNQLSFNSKDKDFDDSADALAIAINHIYKKNGVVVDKVETKNIPSKKKKNNKKNSKSKK